MMRTFEGILTLFVSLSICSAIGTSTQQEENQNQGKEAVNSRLKRDLTSQAAGAMDKFGIGGGFLRKFKRISDGLPPKMRDAFMQGDFSNVTQQDIRSLNVSVIEYIPSSMFSKMNSTLLGPIIEKLISGNRPNAMGRVLEATSDQLSSKFLLDKIKQEGGVRQMNEEASAVLLYNVVNKMAENDGLSTHDLLSLDGANYLKNIPEDQLMKVSDSSAAKFVLSKLYPKGIEGGPEHDDLKDKSLIYKLVEKGYGEADSWNNQTIIGIATQLLGVMPSDFLKRLDPNVVAENIVRFRNAKFESPLQAKCITENFMEKTGFPTKSNSDYQPEIPQNQLMSALNSLGSFAAFANPEISNQTTYLSSIIHSCNSLNLPAPMLAVKNVISKKLKTKRSIENLNYEDIRELGVAVLKNGPPSLMEKAMKTNALNERDLKDIGGNEKLETSFKNMENSFVNGLIAQVSKYAMSWFTKRGSIDFSGLPAAFIGAMGIKGFQLLSNRNLEDAISKLRSNPDALDEAEKGMLLKRLRDSGMNDYLDLPPEISSLSPRKKQRPVFDSSKLKGLPSDNEMRLEYGGSKRVTTYDLIKDPLLVGTLTVKQVNEIELHNIPSVLTLVRKSKDGPQQQTLEALSKRFAEYIRDKSEDYESEDKKLLKHITAAEVTKLPATVLAYFIDPTETSKLSPAVRKEIMKAMGELSTKDHAMIPSRTREEIVNQGLNALDDFLDSDKSLGVAELVTIGSAVSDLSPERIKKLTPIALEQAMKIVHGTSDDDNDKFHYRACLKPEQRRAWRQKIIETYGAPMTWDFSTVVSLCCTLGLLNEEELKSISPDKLASCTCQADENPPFHLKDLKKALDSNCKYELKAHGIEEGKSDPQAPKKKFEKFKSEIALDLDDLESQIMPHSHGRKRRRRSEGGGNGERLTCLAIRIAGTGSYFSKDLLDTLPENEILHCLYELGKSPLGKWKAQDLWKKLGKARGGIPNISFEDLKYANYILTGIPQGDVNRLNLKDDNIRAAFSRPLSLSKNVLEKMSLHLESELNKPVDQFDSGDLITSGNILCGFSTEKLQDIKPEAFYDALPVLKNMDPNCEKSKIAALAYVALKDEVLGNSANWTAADVRSLGILFTGLPPSSVKSIPPESFMGITATTAESIPDILLNSLMEDQAKNLPKFSAQALSDSQISAIIDYGARQALENIKKGPVVTDFASSIHSLPTTTLITFTLTSFFAFRVLL